MRALREVVESSRLLVVGAGGIGCELLKNLVLTGFHDIHVIDLDTIDVSNLNRQFLFQKQHVGQSKALVATHSVLRFNPNANITHHHHNVTSAEFDVNFFKQFTLVLNALDNRAARNHVNRLCLAADVALIESGSSGYLGQVSVIKRGLTECYECTPKPTQRTYPGCTIRNTPSEPIHCIVWAKHLFNQLFGETDIDEDVSPDKADPKAQDNNGMVEKDTVQGSGQQGGIGAERGVEGKGEENGKRAGDQKAQNSGNQDGTADKVSTRQWALDNHYDHQVLFTKLFFEDVRYLLSMGNLWKKRKPPIPLRWTQLPDEHPGCSSGNAASNSRGEGSRMKDQVVWTPMQCAEMFQTAVITLRQRMTSTDCPQQLLVWDKDDDICVQFVTACANLRAYVFGIELKSLFDVKSMAGNIVPAIATTNACVAGMMVMEALKVVQGQFDRCRSIFITRKPNPRGKILVDQIPEKPNGKCYVCSEKTEVYVELNTNTFTIKGLEEKILKQTLNMVAPDVEMADGSGTIIISSEHGETEGLQEKTLAELRVTDGSRLQCDDFMQRFELRLIIVHSDKLEDGVEFLITTDIADLEPKPSKDEKKEMEEDVMLAGDEEVTRKLKKRVAEESPNDDTKRVRLASPLSH